MSVERSNVGRPGWVLAAALALGIALTPPMGLLVGIGLALAALLPLLNPVFGVYLAVLSVPAQELVTLPGGLSLTQAAVLTAAFGWAAHLVGGGGWGSGVGRAVSTSTPLPDPQPLIPWLVLLWALLLSASLTPYSRAEGLKETARWGVAFLVWLIAATTLRQRWEIYGLIGCLLAAPAANALIGLGQFASGDGPPTFRIAADLPYVRAYGTIGQPNSFAGYMNMAWPLAVATAIAQCTMQATWLGRGNVGAGILYFAWCMLLFLVAAVLLAALLASFSRGAWLGAAAGVLGMAAALLLRWANDRRRFADHAPTRGSASSQRISPTGRRSVGRSVGRWSLVVLTLIAVLIGATQALPAPIAARVASIGASVGVFDARTVEVTPENFAVVERMAHLQAGWRMLRARPLVGVGPGNFTPAYPDFALAPWYASRGHAHNFYLHIAAEAGALGLLAYLVLIGAVVAQAVRALRRSSGTGLYGAAVGCCGIIAAVAAHNLFENLHVLNMGIQLAGVWAALAAIGAGRWAIGSDGRGLSPTAHRPSP
ncbi:MAG TPA: O-antigen ligase family protein [Roseiflexaceae bacterium]|nr:O-antigen ligase family protein [Roseiflexaceae bacterium]